MPYQSDFGTAKIAAIYTSRLVEAAKTKTVERSAKSLANEIEATYPFHPSFKIIVAFFKDNEILSKLVA
jgi:hypothetical protein